MLKQYINKNLFINTNNDKIFMIKIAINCGSINESNGISGYSHLLEHVKFNKFKSDDVDFETGIMNAYTSKDLTVYYVKCNEEYMKRAIDVCVNIVFNTNFGDNLLENEKKIVYEEMYTTRTNDFLYQTMLDTIMDSNNKYTNKIIGNKNDLKKATNKKLQHYNDYFYNLVNAKIYCSCSDKKKGVLKKLLHTSLHKYNASITNPLCKKIYGTDIDECDFKRFNYSMIVHNTSFSDVNAVYLVFKTLSGSDVNHLYLFLLKHILSHNNKNSLLFSMLREKKGLIYNINSNLDIYKHFGIYCVGFNTSSDSVSSIFEDIFKIMNDYIFTKKKMTEKKFKKFKMLYLNNLRYNLSQTDYAFQFMMNFVYLKEPFTIEKYVQMIENLTLDEFIRICNESLNLNKMGCYIISKKLSQKEHINAFKNVLEKFKNEV